MNKEEQLQAEVNRLTRELADAKKYIIDINKHWQFRVERLELVNISMIEQLPKLHAQLVEKQKVIDSLVEKHEGKDNS